MAVIDLPYSIVEELRDMPQAQFSEVMNRDLRKDVTPEEYDALRSPEVVDKWYASLIGTSKSVDGQLAAGRQDYRVKRARIDRALLSQPNAKRIAELTDQRLELEEEYGRSRANKLRFKSGLDQWIIEAQQIRNGIHNNLQSRVDQLETAIRQHQMSWPQDVIPEDEDERLWAIASN